MAARPLFNFYCSSVNNCCSSLILTDNLSEVVGIYIAIIGQLVAGACEGSLFTESKTCVQLLRDGSLFSLWIKWAMFNLFCGNK